MVEGEIEGHIDSLKALVERRAEGGQGLADVVKRAGSAVLGAGAAAIDFVRNEKLPKKGASTNNARGQWLLAEKEKRQAKEIDVAWLKDYTEEKK